ncbi:hypothetical protein [Mycobacterium sp. ACS1612]|uniref:hypothetical protein n=1 Tax=Mycobacterium sp. ACS1612 TaxID=1834117 RepID=UPI000B024B70|nr:hypothetical protein [Mycobacterium sp. ACS1612]
MTNRSMADDSSEQVPGQQTGESSVHDKDKLHGEHDGPSDPTGLARGASSD